MGGYIGKGKSVTQVDGYSRAEADAEFATAAQGTTADAALPKAGGALTGAVTTNSTFDGRNVSVDGAKLDGIATGATNVTNNNQLTNGAGYITSYVNTTYSAGTALDLSATTFNVDLSELSTSTTNGDGEYFIVTDTSNAQRKLTKGSINNSGFNNDAGYTTNVGDITGVTASTNLTGGGTSGTVSLSVASSPTFSGTVTANAFAGDGSALTGVSGGKVLQVVSSTKTGTSSTSSTGFVDISGLSVTITPSSTSSKILVMYSVSGTANIGNSGVKFRLLRGSTGIYENGGMSFQGSSVNVFCFVHQAAQTLDSPSTTSATTYKLQFANTGGSTSYINRTENNVGKAASSITVMEIAS